MGTRVTRAASSQATKGAKKKVEPEADDSILQVSQESSVSVDRNYLNLRLDHSAQSTPG